MTRAQKIIYLVEQEDDSDNVIPAKDIPEEETLIIKIVDGTEIRDTLEVDFTAGGNSFAWPDLVPEGEIWIDKDLNYDDKIATMIHEFLESLVMKYFGISYNVAHDLANDSEKVIREFIRNNELGKKDSNTKEIK